MNNFNVKNKSIALMNCEKINDERYVIRFRSSIHGFHLVKLSNLLHAFASKHLQARPEKAGVAYSEYAQRHTSLVQIQRHEVSPTSKLLQYGHKFDLMHVNGIVNFFITIHSTNSLIINELTNIINDFYGREVLVVEKIKEVVQKFAAKIDASNLSELDKKIYARLSPRQFEIYRLKSNGFSDFQISEKLNIAENGISKRVNQINKKISHLATI